MNELVQSILRMPAFDLAIWGPVLTVAAAAAIALIVIEGRHFARRGQRRQWLRLRIATLPIIAATILILVGLTYVVGMRGPDLGIAAYLAVLTLGPFVYFVLHGVVGRLAGLTTGASLWIAASGLAALLAVPLVAQMLHPLIWSASRTWHEAKVTSMPAAPSPYRQQTAARLKMPGGQELWAMHLAADAGIQLQRLDMELPEYSASNVLQGMTVGLCRSGNDLHLFWDATRTLPTLKMYWHDGTGAGHQSVHALSPPTGEAADFEVVWTPTAVTLPVRIPGHIVTLVKENDRGNPVIDSLSDLGAECAPASVARRDRYGLGPPDILRLRLDRRASAVSDWAEFRAGDQPARPSR